MIELALDAFALRVAVIGRAALRGSLLAVGFPAAEGATHIMAPGIARVGEEENAAMPAPGQAGTQIRLGSQNGSQQPVILQDQRGHRILAIPIGLELKMLGDLDCKKPKLPLRMLR